METIWDIGNVIYDAGAAVYNHIKGDHETAKGHWVDAGADLAAAIVPFVPAGATKAARIGTKVVTKSVEKVEANATKDAAKAAVKAETKKQTGRTGKQARLKELGKDDKTSKADKGWIKQEQNSIKRGTRKKIRVPIGKELAHPRGKEAAKGYSYNDANLQNIKNHRTQHKYDNNGKKNKPK